MNNQPYHLGEIFDEPNNQIRIRIACIQLSFMKKQRIKR